jgi:hypothetical protein
MRAVLTLWAGRSWESTGQMAFSQLFAHEIWWLSKANCCCDEIWWLSKAWYKFAPPRPSVVCLGAAFFFSPPRGSAAAGDRLGVLPGGAPAPLGAFWGKGARGRGGGVSALIVAFCVLRFAFCVLRAACRVPRAACRVPCASCLVPRSSRSWFLVLVARCSLLLLRS